MFNKFTILFAAVSTSTVIAAPISTRATGCLNAATAATVQDNISQMKDVANQILSVGFVLPDPFRANDADSATFDTVVTAIADAGTAAAAGDFATTATKVSFVNDAVGGLLDGKVADGLESSIDLNLADLADETNTLLSACAAPVANPAAPVPTPAAPVAASATPVAEVADTCNATAVQDNISQMKDIANQILAVGFVSPDPFRANDADKATFDTVVTAIGDAGTAAAAGDFATASAKIASVNDAVSGLLDGLVADGLESGIDLNLADLADETSTLLSACT